MARDQSHNSICEARKENMVSSEDGKLTNRLARFIKPCAPYLSSAAAIPDTPLLNEIFSYTDHQQWLPDQVRFKNWHIPQKNWHSWIERLAGSYSAIWDDAGIYDAILSSKYEYRCSPDIILGLVEYWCPETNTFVFPWGEVTITLEDVLILGGLPVIGEPVTRPLQGRFVQVEEDMNKKRQEVLRGRQRKATHCVWLKHFMDKDKELEHVGFLSLWLSRYVFPSLPENIVHKNVFPVAIHLSRGTRMELGPAVLASIYKNLTLLRRQAAVSTKDVVASGPLHLLQLWAFERFPLLIGPRNSPNSINSEPRAARWHRITSKIDLEYVRSVIKLPENFTWQPYADSRQSSYCKETGWLMIDDKNLNDDLQSYGRFLCASSLAGVDCEEKYSPHRVAMQFGFDQDLPGNFSGMGYGLANAKFFVAPRSFKPTVTERYKHWWKKYTFNRQQAIKDTLMQKRSERNHANSPSGQGFQDKINIEENRRSAGFKTLMEPRIRRQASEKYTERRYRTIRQDLPYKTKMEHHSFKKDKVVLTASRTLKEPRKMPQEPAVCAEKRHSSTQRSYKERNEVSIAPRTEPRTRLQASIMYSNRGYPSVLSYEEENKVSITSRTSKEPRTTPQVSVMHSNRGRPYILNEFSSKTMTRDNEFDASSSFVDRGDNAGTTAVKSRMSSLSVQAKNYDGHASVQAKIDNGGAFVVLEKRSVNNNEKAPEPFTNRRNQERMKHWTGAANRKASSQKADFPCSRQSQNLVSPRKLSAVDDGNDNGHASVQTKIATGYFSVAKARMNDNKNTPETFTNHRNQGNISPEVSSRVTDNTCRDFDHLDDLSLAEHTKHWTSASNRKASLQKSDFPYSSQSQNLVSPRIVNDNTRKRKLSATKYHEILASKRTACW